MWTLSSHLDNGIRESANTVPTVVQHSDRGTQYVSMHYTDWLVDAGIAPSVGSRGDSYDNALASP